MNYVTAVERKLCPLFLECPSYLVQRNQLLLIETIFITSLTLNIILNGDDRIDTQGHTELHEAVSQYISQTNMF